ncbi:hypothetical protein PV04_10249 [Phialophora macrospora]|uniref:CFEM domain-containing protein n=1 Tax=Phialophora macrospora TaxID=1851006 RepID=A0A0D2DM04_9EURO|nr:hypothetical protein PV04_10249 [Phialophora macrospora]
MKTFTVRAAAVLALALPAFAQSVLDLPQCAQQPILEGFSASGCSLVDIACVCNNDGFVNGLIALIPTVCNEAEVAETIKFASDMCFAYGVTLDLPDDLSGSSAPASTPAPATSSAPASSSITPATSTAEPATSTAPVPTSSSSASVSASSTTESTPSSVSTSESSVASEFTGGAVPGKTVGVSGLLGAVALGLAAAL